MFILTDYDREDILSRSPQHSRIPPPLPAAASAVSPVTRFGQKTQTTALRPPPPARPYINRAAPPPPIYGRPKFANNKVRPRPPAPVLGRPPPVTAAGRPHLRPVSPSGAGPEARGSARPQMDANFWRFSDWRKVS